MLYICDETGIKKKVVFRGAHKSKLTPLLNIKVGYDHIWNQYEGGTGTALGEFTAGIDYKLSEKLNMFLKSGMLFTQQAFFIPIKIGIRF